MKRYVKFMAEVKHLAMYESEKQTKKALKKLNLCYEDWMRIYNPTLEHFAKKNIFRVGDKLDIRCESADFERFSEGDGVIYIDKKRNDVGCWKQVGISTETGYFATETGGYPLIVDDVHHWILEEYKDFEGKQVIRTGKKALVTSIYLIPE